MANRITSNKKQALEAREKELQNEIKYYEKRIEEAKSVKHSTSYYESDSSDSELEFTINSSPSIVELKRQHEMLKTCYQATQELSDVVVVQSEVNIVTDNPVVEGELPISAPGVWKQVMAECRIDLVPFSITFFVHQADGPFGPISYRGLQVLPVKKAHEIELANSTLATLKQPSPAIEIIRSYAVAHRSRRTTLAKLSQKYADSLFMEPMPNGGYVLKCAGILEISWTLQFKSHVAPFNHKMKFDLEYMDESYIKIITQAHRQLSDPSITTDERTLLLAKIINTCLEAQIPTQELHESLQSDPESIDKLRPTTLNMEDAPENSDARIMAPPKYVPKNKKVPKNKLDPKDGPPPNSLFENNAPKLPSNNEATSVEKSSKTTLSKPKKSSENPGKKSTENNPSKIVSKNTQILSENKISSKKTSENQVSKTVTEKVSKTVMEKAPKTVTEKAPKTVAEKASKKVTEKAPKTVTEKTPKTVTEKAPKAMTEKAPKSVTEKAPKTVTEKAPKTVTEKSTKTVTENKNSKVLSENRLSKKTTEKLAKPVSEKDKISENINPNQVIEKSSKKTSKNQPKPISEHKISKTISENPKSSDGLSSKVSRDKISAEKKTSKTSEERSKIVSEKVSSNNAIKRSSTQEELTQPKRKKTALPVPVLKNNFAKPLPVNPKTIHKDVKRLSNLSFKEFKMGLPVPVMKNSKSSNKMKAPIQISKTKGRENIPTLANLRAVSKIKK